MPDDDAVSVRRRSVWKYRGVDDEIPWLVFSVGTLRQEAIEHVYSVR